MTQRRRSSKINDILHEKLLEVFALQFRNVVVSPNTFHTFAVYNTELQ